MAALTSELTKYSGSTPADDIVPQIITDSGNFTLDFKQLGFCALHSSSRLLDLKDADFNVQQNLATCPHCKSTNTRFYKHGIIVLDWPANSPDLNPMNMVYCPDEGERQQTQQYR